VRESQQSKMTEGEGQMHSPFPKAERVSHEHLIGARGSARQDGRRALRHWLRRRGDVGNDNPAPPFDLEVHDVTDPAERAAVVELALRKSDGLEVALLWSRRSGAVWVDVLHVRTGENLTIDADPDKALDVYYHPFAYCLAGAASEAR
jgi:hypothetical protein